MKLLLGTITNNYKLPDDCRKDEVDRLRAIISVLKARFPKRLRVLILQSGIDMSTTKQPFKGSTAERGSGEGLTIIGSHASLTVTHTCLQSAIAMRWDISESQT